MDKQAAEKIASEYYELGVKLAHEKLASVVGKGVHAGLSGSVGLGVLPALMAGSDAVARRLAPGTFNKVDSLKDLSKLTNMLPELKAAKEDALRMALDKFKMFGVDTKGVLQLPGLSDHTKGLVKQRFEELKTLPSVVRSERHYDKIKALQEEATKVVDDFGGELSGAEKLIDASPVLAALGGSAVGGRKLYKALNRQAGYK